jgi:hypothetical protein
MTFNATFNNISVISWQSVLLVEETGGPRIKLYRIRTEATICFFAVGAGDFKIY